jgi:hypothetical protein
MIACQSHYLHDALDLTKRAKVIAELVNQLTKFGTDKFDTIVFRGMSGALVVPSVADKLGKGMLMIRKQDGNHSMYGIEGNVALESYVIIDDLIASGGTLNSIMDGVDQGLTTLATDNELPLRLAKCKAIFLYHDARSGPFLRASNDQSIPLFGMYYNQSTNDFVYGKSPMGN